MSAVLSITVFLSMVDPAFQQDKEACGTWKLKPNYEKRTGSPQHLVTTETACRWTCMGKYDCTGIDWIDKYSATAAQCYLHYDHHPPKEQGGVNFWDFDRVGICEVECQYSFVTFPGSYSVGGALESKISDLLTCQTACKNFETCIGFDWWGKNPAGNQCYLLSKSGELIQSDEVDHYDYRRFTCKPPASTLGINLFMIAAVLSWLSVIGILTFVAIKFGGELRGFNITKGLTYFARKAFPEEKSALGNLVETEEKKDKDTKDTKDAKGKDDKKEKI